MSQAEAVPAAYPGSRTDLHVEHYDLDLRYRVATNRLSAHATLHVTVREATDRIHLDLHRLRLGAVTVDGAPARHSHRAGRVAVTPRQALEPGDRVTIGLDYSGAPVPTPSAWGPLGWEELADGALTANQPTGAPSWFPCVDDPADRATYRVAVTVDQPYLAVAHGRLTSTRRRAGSTTFVYEEPHPTPTYLATVQVGRYETFPLVARRVPQSVVTDVPHAAGVRLALTDHDAVMAHHEAHFGPYPFSTYTLVVTPDHLEIPLEAQGIGIFGANHLNGESRRLIPHELAHQWFGNSVSVASWQHIWLNEGPACYAEWLWSAASGGQDVHALARTWHRRLAGQPQDLVLADPGYSRIFDDRVYKRGALTCYALDVALGRDGFVELLTSWTAERAGTAVTTDDFRAHALAVAPVARRAAVGGLLETWLDSAGLPPLPR